MNRLVSALGELRKRYLFQIAVVYAGVAWFFLELTDFARTGAGPRRRRSLDVPHQPRRPR